VTWILTAQPVMGIPKSRGLCKGSRKKVTKNEYLHRIERRMLAMNKRSLLALALSLLIVPAFAKDFPKGSPKFVDSYRKVLSDAKKSGKPIVVVFSATWCPPCQAMKHDVYPSPAVQALQDKFEWAYLDVDDHSNDKAAKEFGVNGIPHVQFLASDGKAIDKQVGSSSAASFAKTLEGVLKKVGTSSTKATESK
jgi:thioredoxin 1